jgi:flagellar basal-body rod protein FlgB
MSEINRIGSSTLSRLTGVIGNDYSGQGTVKTFSASYALALANAPPSQEASSIKWLLSSTTSRSFLSAVADGSKHIPLKGQQQEGGDGVHEIALGLRAYRQQLLASNIANADTPGYKAVDIDVQEALRSTQTTTEDGVVKLSTTADGHISTQASPRFANIPLKYSIPQQPSIDGNTVEMDVERGKFSDNTLMYQFSLKLVGDDYKGMLELLKSLK